MINPDETVTISKREYEELLDKEVWLSCLESAGVYNWSGYEVAQEIYDEIYDEEN